MKVTKFFALALASFAIASCSKETNESAPAAQGKDTYAGVSISFPKTMTRAADANAASTDEGRVHSLGVYVIDDATSVMHSGFYSVGQFTVTGGKYTLNAALKTTTGTKSIYVVLNPTTALQPLLSNSTVFGTNPINGVASDFEFATGNSTDRALTMSSVAAAKSTLAVVTEAEALAAPVAINVQRNTAKVAVKSGVTTATGGAVANMQFALVVQAKKSYLIQQGGNTFATVQTPGRAVAITATPADYSDFFTTLAAPATADYKNVNPTATANNLLAGFYATENVNTTNMAGNTTAAILRAQFTPTNGTVVTDYNTATGVKTMGNLTAGQSFWVRIADNSYWSKAAYDKAIVAGGTHSILATDFSREYANGIGYYRLWVQDAAGTRGVIRNNYYVLSVTKVNGPGAPTVPGVNPADPDQPEDPTKPVEDDTFVSVDVTVLAWDVQSSDHEI